MERMGERPATVAPWMAGAGVAVVFLISLILSWPERPAREHPPAIDPAPLDVAALSAKRISAAEATLIDDARIIAADAEPHNWLAHGRTFDEQRYSPLDQINIDTVGELGLAWSFRTDTTRGLEASPIVADGYMYATGNWGVVYALDARTGEEMWRYDPEVPGEWARYACCDIVNRGVAVYHGKVYVGSLDGRLIALDAETGDVVWEINTIDRDMPYTITGAPRVLKGKVLIGNGGAEYGVRGYVSAYDAETGDLVWRFYTVPGNPAEGFEHPELEWAAQTWISGEWWEIGGGGTVWDSMAYDPMLDLVYIGVGNGSPWTRYLRDPGGGDNLFLSSVLALRPDTGELVWHYQTTPGDNWDYTATQHMILADLEIEGERRRVLMQAPKNGFFYVLDRETGELISVNNYVAVTWATHVDMTTGRPVENPALSYRDRTQIVLPSPNGGHNWHPMAFNPDTGLVYIPTMEVEGIYARAERELDVKPGWWNLGMDWEEYVGTINHLVALTEGNLPINHGYLKAWNPVANEEVWAVELHNFWNGGVLTTAGNLVFQGTGDGRFVAYDAATGDVVWETPVHTGIIAPPVSYMVDGVQYIAVMVGWGGVGIPSGDARTSAAARYGNDGKLLVYKLGGEGRLPELIERDQTIPEPPVTIEASAEELHEGHVLYMAHCGVCHGALAVSSGVLPDLRRMDANTHENFSNIVLGGWLAERGMASYADLIDEDDTRKIHAFLIERARQDRAAAMAQ
jgi:quinohemoprotein ethanol dehydrogenase